MIDQSNFFNVRKTAFALAGGPLVLLLVIVAVDFSWQQFRLRQAAQLCSKLTPMEMSVKNDGNNCPNGVRQELQNRPVAQMEAEM
mgnify:CR=1 FL=1